MKNVVIIGLIVIILAGAGIYLLGKKQAQPVAINAPITTTQPSTNPSFTIPDTDALKAGGSSYADPGGIFSFLYPSDYKLDTSDPQHTRIYKQGTTQTGQTEMYDGVLVVFEPINLQGKSLSEWVDSSIKQSTADGTSEVITPKTPTTINNYPGFTYELRGLGTSTYTVVQKDAQSDNAVSITYLVADPKKVGFQQEVDAIFSTLRMQK